MIQNNLVFIDIETVPSAEQPSADDIAVPANYKDEAKIRAYKKVHVEEAWRKQALDSMKGQIICIGYSCGDIVDTIALQPELDTVELFSFRMRELREKTQSVLQFCGWNISTFDIPWLWRKAIQYDLPELRKIIPHGNRILQTDLMKIWAADYKDYVSLDSCAQYLGIPHDTGKGSEVFDHWRKGDIWAIREHCEADIRTTKAIYERIYGHD